MKQRRPTRPFPLAAVIIAFCAGVLVDWSLRTYGPPQPVDAPTMVGPPAKPPLTAAPIAAAPASTPTATTGVASLRLPIDGMNLDLVRGGFYEARAGHRHEAIDILAPRNTPVHAVENGTVAKLFLSKAGGNTIYQFDPSQRFCYYYAHLERYADGLKEGDIVSRGDVIGYVGTSGNAPPNTPHLHFAVFQLTLERHWWQGTPLDPYRIFDD